MPNPPQLALAGSTDFRRRGEQRPSSSPQRLLEGSSGRRYFADFTSVGVVEASPNACWDLIGDTCSWLTSVARVREVPRSRVVSGVFGEHASWDIVQTTKVNLLGKDLHVPMLMAISSNSYTREMHFTCKKRNKLVAKMEGGFKVIPMGDSRGLRKALPNVSRERLEQLLREGAQGGSHGRNQKSIVVYRQALQPSMTPPVFVRGLLHKHLGRSIDHVMRDLQRGAARRKQQESAMSSTSAFVNRSLLPALAVIGSFGRFVADVAA